MPQMSEKHPEREVADQFYIESFRFEIQMLESRSNIFLLSHAFLLTAVSQSLGASGASANAFRWIIILLAIAMTLLWYVIGTRKHNNILRIHERLTANEKYKAIYVYSSGGPNNTFLVGRVLPLLLGLSWIAAAFFLTFHSHN